MNKFYLEDPNPSSPGTSNEDFLKTNRAHVVYAQSEEDARALADVKDGNSGRWLNPSTLCDDYGPTESTEAKVVVSSPYPGGKLLLFA